MHSPRSLHPLLQEAIDHAHRLIELVGGLDGRNRRESSQLWLVGRQAEIGCVVDEITREWRRGAASNADAATSIQAYLQLLHRGIATHFGELAPSCCIGSLVITASSASFLSVTPAFPVSTKLSPRALATTWEVVEEGDLLEVTYLPQ